MKKGLLSLLVACTFTLSTTGCFGSFALTKTVKGFGDGISSNVIIKEIVFFIGTLPIGGFCMFADWLVFNTLEYWTGSNPVALGDTYHETDANGNSVTAVKMEDGSLYMRLDAASGESQELVLQQDEDIIRILDAKGNVLKETGHYRAML
jgi:hypothetical protein